MGNKHPVMTVFGISLRMEAGHAPDHSPCFHCECKWNSSPQPLSVCPSGATCKQGPAPRVCVQCVTPAKTPTPTLQIPNAKRAQREKVSFFQVIVCFFLVESQDEETKVSDVHEQCEKKLPAEELFLFSCPLREPIPGPHMLLCSCWFASH